jgi:poly-gamma-glutamate synthesis protein (capsule biosynthesis protein)
MKLIHYLFLLILLLLFFVFNFFVYTTSFEIPIVTDDSSSVQLVEIKEITTDYPSVLNFGDIMFDRGVRNIMENRNRDPFEYIKNDLEIIKKYNFFIVNLEGPIVEIDRSKCQQKAYNFQFSSTTPELLKNIGINMVNIANNHSYDCFTDGYKSTKQYLEKSGIDYMGDSELEKSYVIKSVKGKKIAFVGIDETTHRIQISSFYPLIKKLNSENDFVVVNIHWGVEYEPRATSTQIAIAHNLIDNGADVVFGHHPHVVEPVEVYKGKAIFYSLGNFVFDQDFGDTTVGLGVGVEFADTKSIFTLFPFNIKLFAPDFMKEGEREVFCSNYLNDLTHIDCVFELSVD